MQRRRRQLLTRRGARRGSQRRGLLLAFVVVFSFFGARIQVAKLYHFESDDTGVFGRMKRRIEHRRKRGRSQVAGVR